MKIDLSDKVVLVTGASRGIGKAIAMGLAASGAKVAIHYHANREAAQVLAKRLGSAAVHFQADFNRSEEVVRLMDEVIHTF